MDALPPWPLVEDLLRTLVLPAFAAAAVVLATVCLLTKSPALRAAGAALALAAGLAAGNYFRKLLVWWPPDVPASEEMPAGVMARGWAALLPVTLAALAGGLLSLLSEKKLGWPAGFVLRLLTAACCVWWLAEALEPWTARQTFMMTAAGAIVSWEALHRAALRTAGRMPLTAAGVCWGAAAAAVLIFAHSARFSDLAVLMTASLAGAGLVSVLWKVDMAPLFAGPAVFLPALMLAGAVNTYSEVPLQAFAAVAFAPCALWLLLLPPLRRLPAPALAAVTVLLVLIPGAAGVAMAAWAEDLDFDL